MKPRLFLLLIALLTTQMMLAQNPSINKGSGSFTINGNSHPQGDSITIFYHKPATFTKIQNF